MLQASRRNYILGVVLCAATLLSVRWIYRRYYVKPVVPQVKSKEQKELKERLNNSNRNKRSSRSNQSIRSSSQLSYLGHRGEGSHHTAGSVISSRTNLTSNLIFFDVEPNLHFFKIYQDQLCIVESIPKPRNDRTEQLFCESQEEFLAKVSCLRNAFQDIFYDNDNCYFFVNSGREVLKLFLAHVPKDLENCLAAYEKLLAYVTDETNHEEIEQEISKRKIPVLSFYDLVVDYIILESLDDLENPPSVVANVVSNSWLSAKFRVAALQSAVSTALKYKRSQLTYQNGFFAHFYSLLDYLSPNLAWGFLGSDEELQFRCEILKETLSGLCRDIFSFDRVRYTSYQDLKSDIMTITRERSFFYRRSA